MLYVDSVTAVLPREAEKICFLKVDRRAGSGYENMRMCDIKLTAYLTGVKTAGSPDRNRINLQLPRVASVGCSDTMPSLICELYFI